MTHSIGAAPPGATRESGAIFGWDIGGANTKAARVDVTEAGFSVTRALSLPLAMERDGDLLVATLRRLAASLDAHPAAHAVTMTAELSRSFRTKREGVGFVLDSVAAAFPDGDVMIYGVDGRFRSPAEARAHPLDVAAANWAATARFVGREAAECILVDIGSTSADLIPIVKGEPVTIGRTDPDRLLSGELVYSGAIRTPVEAVARTVPLRGGDCPLAPEGFALMGDAYLWLGRLDIADYGVATPDGRPATREYAGERLARAVCADPEMVDADAVTAIALALAESQVLTIAEALRRVAARHPEIRTAVVTGLGEFIASDGARRAGLDVVSLNSRIGEAARMAPAAAVAWLLADARAVA